MESRCGRIAQSTCYRGTQLSDHHFNGRRRSKKSRLLLELNWICKSRGTVKEDTDKMYMLVTLYKLRQHKISTVADLLIYSSRTALRTELRYSRRLVQARRKASWKHGSMYA
jgi:hypothetical protein